MYIGYTGIYIQVLWQVPGQYRYCTSLWAHTALKPFDLAMRSMLQSCQWLWYAVQVCICMSHTSSMVHVLWMYWHWAVTPGYSQWQWTAVHTEYPGWYCAYSTEVQLQVLYWQLWVYWHVYLRYWCCFPLPNSSQVFKGRVFSWRPMKWTLCSQVFKLSLMEGNQCYWSVMEGIQLVTSEGPASVYFEVNPSLMDGIQVRANEGCPSCLLVKGPQVNTLKSMYTTRV